MEGSLSNKRIIEKKEKQLEGRVLTLVGEIPSGYATIIILKKGALLPYGDLFPLNYATGNGRLANTRCVGARSSNPRGRVFVVWKNGDARLKIGEYKGETLFPNFKRLLN